jgi:hypothetical protein
VNVSTGQRTPWKTLTPADPSGVDGMGPVEITPDAKAYAYGCSRDLSDLYLAEGLR